MHVRPPPQWPASKRSKAIKVEADGVGEVRFDTPHAAQVACQQMNGAPLSGAPLQVSMDANSKDGTKVLVTGIPLGVEWQELKDHFAPVGSLAFVEIRGARRNGPKLTGEVRFDTAELAEQALQLDGSELDGHDIGVSVDPHSQDATKLHVKGLPPGCRWQELKDHFSQMGTAPVYADVNSAASGACIGEVRYDVLAHAKMALQQLNGSTLGEATIWVMTAPGSVDGSKLVVQGLTPGTQWQELKDHFSRIGQVAFAAVHPIPKWAAQATHSPPHSQVSRPVRPMAVRPPAKGFVNVKGKGKVQVRGYFVV